LEGSNVSSCGRPSRYTSRRCISSSASIAISFGVCTMVMGYDTIDSIMPGMPAPRHQMPVSGISVYCALNWSSLALPPLVYPGELPPPPGVSAANAIHTPEKSGAERAAFGALAPKEWKGCNKAAMANTASSGFLIIVSPRSQAFIVSLPYADRRSTRVAERTELAQKSSHLARKAVFRPPVYATPGLPHISRQHPRQQKIGRAEGHEHGIAEGCRNDPEDPLSLVLRRGGRRIGQDHEREIQHRIDIGGSKDLGDVTWVAEECRDREQKEVRAEE